MARSTIISFVVMATISVALTDRTTLAQSKTPGESKKPEPGAWILRESFDDGVTGRTWGLYADDPNVCWVEETGGCLELRSTAAVRDEFAGYVSKAWRLDPAGDIEMKVDLHYNLVTNAGGWIGFGLAPSAAEPRDPYVSVGVGCANRFAYYWYEARDGLSLKSGFAERFVDRATVYLSYSAAEDELYLGDGGYGADNAWVTLPGVIRGEWAGRPLFLVIGGTADGQAIDSGEAFADNLLVESGQVLEASLSDVHRFRSPTLGTYFYTIDSAEKDFLVTEHADVWTYEGAAYRAFRTASDPATQPVYRFWSNATSSHYYTIDAAETDRLVNEFADLWVYEGVAFYAYAAGQQPSWAVPVYRFEATGIGSYLYTISEKEIQTLLNDKKLGWTYEGIAWYALP